MTEKVPYARRNIGPDDVIYKNTLEMARNADGAILGEGLPEAASRLADQYMDATDMTAFENALWELVAPTAMAFANKLRGSGSTASAFAALISRAAMNPDIARFFNSHDDISDAENFATALENHEIPAHIFVSLLVVHVRQMEAARGILERSVEEWKREFMQAAQEAVVDGYLSAHTDLEVVERRLDEMPVIGIDPFLTGEHDSGGTYGAMLVRINLYARVWDQRQTFFHEGAHGVISGRQEVAEKRPESEEEYGVRKSGLSLFSYRSKGNTYQRRLGWMDEAVTEEVAGYLSGDGPRAYPDERELLAELKNEGLSHAVIMDAYQEDWPAEVTLRTVRLPAMQALYRELHAQLPKSWLADQDAFFKKRMGEFAMGK